MRISAEVAISMDEKKSLLARYWQVIRNRSTVSLGAVAVFFFHSGIDFAES